MKLKAGVGHYPLPPYSGIESAVIHFRHDNGEMLHNMLCYVRPNVLRRMQIDERAVPDFFALIGDEICVRPIPDKDYDITVRFYPPMQEI